MNYLVIQTALIDGSPFPPRLVRVSVNEFASFLEAARFANRRPEFAVLNKTTDARAVAQLMALPQ